MQEARGEGAVDGAAPTRRPPGSTFVWLLLTAAGVIAVDQITKSWALDALAGGPRSVLPGVDLSLHLNPGGAFGLLQGMPGFFLVASLVVAGLILVMARSVDSTPAAVALGFVLGGGLGNVADRLFRDLDGRVVDFIDVGWWPVFNVADMAIVGGATFLVVTGWRSRDAA